MRDDSLYIKKDGRAFQMLDGFSGKTIPFAEGKHNYSKKDIDSLAVGRCIKFMPMYGNKKPICTILKRIK